MLVPWHRMKHESEWNPILPHVDCRGLDPLRQGPLSCRHGIATGLRFGETSQVLKSRAFRRFPGSVGSWSLGGSGGRNGVVWWLEDGR